MRGAGRGDEWAVCPAGVPAATTVPASFGADIRLRAVMMIATATTMTAPATRCCPVIASLSTTAPRMTATTGFT
jgi:hypothetical protein